MALADRVILAPEMPVTTVPPGKLPPTIGVPMARLDMLPETRVTMFEPMVPVTTMPAPAMVETEPRLEELAVRLPFKVSTPVPRRIEGVLPPVLLKTRPPRVWLKLLSSNTLPPSMESVAVLLIWSAAPSITVVVRSWKEPPLVLPPPVMVTLPVPKARPVAELATTKPALT